MALRRDDPGTDSSPQPLRELQAKVQQAVSGGAPPEEMRLRLDALYEARERIRIERERAGSPRADSGGVQQEGDAGAVRHRGARAAETAHTPAEHRGAADHHASEAAKYEIAGSMVAGEAHRAAADAHLQAIAAATVAASARAAAASSRAHDAAGRARTKVDDAQVHRVDEAAYLDSRKREQLEARNAAAPPIEEAEGRARAAAGRARKDAEDLWRQPLSAEKRVENVRLV